MRNDSDPSAGSSGRAGAAGALGGLLLRIADAGIELRERGECAAPDRDELRHRWGGHDDGCLALGLPEHRIAAAIGRWDRAGAARLLLEAVEDAIREIVALGPDGWTAIGAREALRYAVELRIAPTVNGGVDASCLARGSGRDLREGRGPSRRSVV
ncbi:MAG: hypothetical protein QM606_10935 [Leucobacter sp.]